MPQPTKDLLDQAIAFLDAELAFMANELGVEDELLDSRWAARMVAIKWPLLTEDEVSFIVQTVWWF